MKNLTNKDYQLTEKCLEHLEDFSKEQLLEEMEQLLLSLAERYCDLEPLENHYLNNGLRKKLKPTL
jgi:hypothetical protein